MNTSRIGEGRLLKTRKIEVGAKGLEEAAGLLVETSLMCGRGVRAAE